MSSEKFSEPVTEMCRQREQCSTSSRDSEAPRRADSVEENTNVGAGNQLSHKQWSLSVHVPKAVIGTKEGNRVFLLATACIKEQRPHVKYGGDSLKCRTGKDRQKGGPQMPGWGRAAGSTRREGKANRLSVVRRDAGR